MQKKGMKNCRISPGWWSAFCKHWPQISLRKGDSFPIAREKMTTHGVFESYFNMLEETLEEYNLKDKPAQIYNCDKSGMPLEHKLPKTISLKGSKKVRQITAELEPSGDVTNPAPENPAPEHPVATPEVSTPLPSGCPSVTRFTDASLHRFPHI